LGGAAKEKKQTNKTKQNKTKQNKTIDYKIHVITAFVP